MATNLENQLSEEQLNLLLNAREIRQNDGEPVIYDREMIEQVKSVLSDALAETTGLPAPEALELEQMAEQLEADHDDAVAVLAQQPETGDQPDEIDASVDNDEPEPADVLTAADPATAREAKTLLSKAKMCDLNGRLPGRADELRAEAADLLGCNEDAVSEINVPTDPRQVVD